MSSLYNWKNKTDEQIAKLIKQNQTRLAKIRESREDLWKLLTKIFRPRRYSMLADKSTEKGKRFGAKVYDQRPSNALHKFVAGKLGYMINRSVPWIQFISMDAQTMRLDHVKRYCQEAAEQVLYAAGRSNLYSAIVPHTLDADTIGTSAMIPMTDTVKDRIVFDPVNPANTYLDIDAYGDPIVYHRTLRKTRMAALHLFGRDALPNNWFYEGELKDAFTEDDYIWAVYPNDDRDLSSYLSSDMPFKVFCTLLSDDLKNTDNTSLVYKSGRRNFPICCRTGRDSGDPYGTSIAAECLTSALMLNKLGEKSLLQVHRITEPPVIASRSIQAIHRNPAGITYVDDINREGVKTWLDKQPWPYTDAQMERLYAQLDDRMFIRFFEMLSMNDMKSRTAYEVSQMLAEKATLMSTIIDTFEQETLEPAILALLTHEEESGRMPDVPPELLLEGGKIDIRYLGPLSQLQRALLRSKGTVDALAIIQQMMTMEPKVGWKFNWMEMAEDVAVAQGMPQKFIQSDETVAQIEQQYAQQQQAQQQMAMLEQASKAVPNLSSKPEQGSPADALLGG